MGGWFHLARRGLQGWVGLDVEHLPGLEVQGADIGVRGDVLDGESWTSNQGAPSFRRFRAADGLREGQEGDPALDDTLLTAVGAAALIDAPLHHDQGRRADSILLL